jgi:2-polyprenyl-6-methoxyphenol hydroxylase-like FAD-dependent oxidoreductase
MDHVVVAGAGISGLAACLVLSHIAARVTLVERLERPAEVGAALALQANGMVVLDRLGLLGTVQASGARIERMDMRNVSSRRLLTARLRQRPMRWLVGTCQHSSTSGTGPACRGGSVDEGLLLR